MLVNLFARVTAFFSVSFFIGENDTYKHAMFMRWKNVFLINDNEVKR